MNEEYHQFKKGDIVRCTRDVVYTHAKSASISRGKAYTVSGAIGNMLELEGVSLTYHVSYFVPTSARIQVLAGHSLS